MKCKISITVGVYFFIIHEDGLSLHHQNSSKNLCGAKSTPTGAGVFSNSNFPYCATGKSFLVHFRGNESLTVNFSISGVEASNTSSVEVFSVSNVLRI